MKPKLTRSVVIASNAGAAWDELGRWVETLLSQQEITEIIHRTHPHARVVFDNDPRLPNAAPDHHSRIRAHAATIVQEHRELVRRAPTPEVAGKHLDAIAAWQMVLSERDRTQLPARLRLAITASGRVVDCRNAIR